MTRKEIERSQETWKLAVYDAYRECEEFDFIDAYRYGDMYIVHGEIRIICFTSQYDILWDFFGTDILICPDSSSSFEMREDGIWVKDWSGYSYLVNYEGECINTINPKQDKCDMVI